MDPQKLIFLNKKVVQSERLTSLVFTLGFSGLLVLIEKGAVPSFGFSYPVYWFSLVVFIGVGITQYFWDPYTHAKVLAYNLILALAGALVSVFIVGFDSPLVFLGWLMLLVTSAVYFLRHITALMYGFLLISSLAWIGLNYDKLTLGGTVITMSSTIFVGLIVIYVIDIWNLFNRSVNELDNSMENEKIVRQRLSSLINSMADGVLAIDENCKIIEYNGALLNILDLNLTLRGKNINSIGKFIDADNQPVDIEKFIKTTKKQTVNRDFRIVYNDETSANLYISIASVHLGFGHDYTKGFVLVVRDITREKSLEEERDEFISVISHELRTPIAIAEGEVSNAAYTSEKIGADKKVIESINQAHAQVLFLSDMVNDLATLSRAERGKLDVEVETINLAELFQEFSEDYKPQAGKKGLTLKIDLNPDAESLKSSKLYVKEILQNFITNSIKYTEKGSVTISAKKDKAGIYFEISDTGIGISKVDQEKVFDKFFRSEDYRTRANSGTGLGLYVTMKLAKIIHASIDLKSQPNHGSTFGIYIPDID